MLLAHCLVSFFFFHDPAPTLIYTLSLHDALPILEIYRVPGTHETCRTEYLHDLAQQLSIRSEGTRLNSSHGSISYAVFCLKKKKWFSILHTKVSWTLRVTGLPAPVRMSQDDESVV